MAEFTSILQQVRWPTVARTAGARSRPTTCTAIFDWESVVVKGPFSPKGSPYASWNYDTALAALRRLDPRTLTDDDVAPQRDIVFGIHASEISGRCSVSSEVRDELAVV